VNFYNHYIGDYQRDTGHLSLVEDAIYRRLLDTYYATERPLPNDPKQLARIVRATTPAERKAITAVVDQFFPVAADGLRHNARADREIPAAQDRITKARENGRHGGRPPRNKPQPTGSPEPNPAGNPAGNRTQTQRVNSPSPRPEPSPSGLETAKATGPNAEGNLDLSAPELAGART
jgi:uncharacterized protein YdaU (DUF1376 family)